MRSRTAAALVAALVLGSQSAAQTRAVGGAESSGVEKPPAVRLSHASLKRRAVACKVPSYVLRMPLRRMTPVNVEILIDEKGRVQSAQVVSGHPLLRASAVRAAYSWRFRPFRVKGKAETAAGLLTLFFSSEAGEMERQCKGLPRAP